MYAISAKLKSVSKFFKQQCSQTSYITLLSVVVFSILGLICQSYGDSMMIHKLQNDLNVKQTVIEKLKAKYETTETQINLFSNSEGNFCHVCLTCQLEPGKKILLDRCFSLESNESLGWKAARRVCRGKGGDLASLSRFMDMDHLYDMIIQAFPEIIKSKGATNIWLGATDKENEGEWYWVDDVKVETKHPRWKDSLLDDFGTPDEDCLLMRLDFKEKNWGVWDYPCIASQYYLCQYN